MAKHLSLYEWQKLWKKSLFSYNHTNGFSVKQGVIVIVKNELGAVQILRHTLISKSQPPGVNFTNVYVQLLYS